MIKNIFPKGYGILRWDLFSCVKAVPGIIRRKCFKSFPKTTKKSHLTLTTWSLNPTWMNILQTFNLLLLPYHSLLKWKYSGIQNEYFISIPHLALCHRHNVEMTYRGGTDTIRGGMERGRSKYSIRVLAGADDNLGPNLRQLSASVAWHPVLWGF